MCCLCNTIVYFVLDCKVTNKPAKYKINGDFFSFFTFQPPYKKSHPKVAFIVILKNILFIAASLDGDRVVREDLRNHHVHRDADDVP